jgi:hypothetical protein
LPHAHAYARAVLDRSQLGRGALAGAELLAVVPRRSITQPFEEQHEHEWRDQRNDQHRAEQA